MSDSPSASEGRRIGVYEILSLLGHGGMASVYRARVTEDKPELGLRKGDEVAIKILHVHLAAISEFLRRFTREANVATKLTHPNVARVLEQGTVSQGRPYLVMELARGRKLGDILSTGKPLPPEQIFSIMRQVAEVLEEARKVGIIHRDIKPDNLIIDKQGNVKVLDFGLVRDEVTMSLVSSAISITGKSIGTPAYMSPEQGRGGREIDHRSDLYSLGVTAYHMATGKAPYPGPTPTAYIRQHETQIPERIDALNCAIPRPLIAVIYRLMAKTPADRYQTADDLLKDLERAGKGEMPSKVYRFRKVRQFTARRVAAIVAIAVVAVLVAVFVWDFLTSDAAQTEIRRAESQARQAAEAGDHVRAVAIINSAVTTHAGRRQLIGPLEELRDRYLPLAAAEEKEREAKLSQEYERLFQAGLAALKEKQHLDALESFELAQKKRDTAEVRLQIENTRSVAERAKKSKALLAEAKAAFAGEGYGKASELAEQGVNHYFDTDEGAEFSKLRIESESRRAATAAEKRKRARELEMKGEEYERAGNLRSAHSSWQSALELSEDAGLKRRFSALTEMLARYDNLVAEGRKLLDEARTARNRQKCIDARQRLEEAKAVWPNAEISRLITEANAAASAIKDPIAVVDFQLKGNVGVPDAEKIVPRLLLSEFADTFEQVTRTHLVELLKEKKLGMTDLMSAEKARQYGRLIPVKYLVVGDVMKGDKFFVSAQLVEVGPGIIRSPRKVEAPTYRELEAQIPLLGKILCMNDQEYRKWQDEIVNYPKFMAEAKAACDGGRWREALVAYQKAFAMIPTQEARDGITLATQKLAEEKDRTDRYQKAVDAAKATLAKGDFEAAAREVDAALALFPNGAEVRAVYDQLTPTLTVKAELDGQEYRGAQIAINGIVQSQATPYAFKLERDRTYDVEVTIPAQGGEFYTREARTIRTDRSGPQTFRALISKVMMPVPPGFKPKPGTAAEPHSNTGWAKEIVHDKTGIEMVFIPAGEFMMGSKFSPEETLRRYGTGFTYDYKWEHPQHKVRITTPFYMGKYEVTQGEWQKVMQYNPSEHKRGDGLPVEQVSWNDCQGFFRKAGDGLRLPTEAEWEYACRAGSTTAYQWGDDASAGQGWCNVGDKTLGERWLPFALTGFKWADGYEFTAPVGNFRPNAWGLYDMVGNVSEWCQDWLGKYEVPAGGVLEDPKGPTSGDTRVSRGGNFMCIPQFSRSACRLGYAPDARHMVYGFRAALDLR